MLKVAKKAQFDAPVKIWIAGEDKPETFNVTFRYLTKSEWDSLAKETDESGDRVEGLSKIIIDWRDVCDENGNQIAYTRENLEMILDVFPGAANDINNCYVRELFAARVKN